MGHIIELPDEIYKVLEELVQHQQQTPQQVLEHLITSATPDDGPYLETEEWFHYLGVSGERIKQAKEQAARDDDADA